MSQAYELIGDALLAYMEAMDITDATPDDWPEESLTWGDTLSRPPKANELNSYPAIVVAPSGDGQETGDTETDFDAVSYAVFIVVSYAEASAAETMLKKIVDIARTQFRELRRDPSPLLAAAYNLTFTGEWGGTPDQGERYYKLNITTFVHESLLDETP